MSYYLQSVSFTRRFYTDIIKIVVGKVYVAESTNARLSILKKMLEVATT